jgi:hypothetical protein
MKTDMPEIPLLLSGEMVRAFLDGRKTETRRVLNPQPWLTKHGIHYQWKGTYFLKEEFASHLALKVAPKPPFRIWFRETWQDTSDMEADGGYVYRATDPDWETMEGWKWRPSIYMPRAACRAEAICHAFLIDRLQEITEEGAVSEGMAKTDPFPRLRYKSLWDRINGKKHHWKSNPFVRVYAKLERVK